MHSQEEGFRCLLHVLDDSGSLPHVMIIGSWAEYLYSRTGIVDYSFSLKTQDIDIFLPNIRRPFNEINLSYFLKENGFNALFHGNGLVKFDYFGILEVEFLARELGAGKNEPYSTRLSVPAQGLHDTDILAFSTVDTEFDGCKVKVPAPEAYLVHKIVINKDRSVQKKEKDLLAIENLFYNCFRTQNDFPRRFMKIFDSLSKSQKKRFTALLSIHRERLKIVSNIVSQYCSYIR